MAKKSKARAGYDMATIFFAGIIILSAIGAIAPVQAGIMWLVVAICGAVVAIQNIRISEENSFLLGVIALVAVLTAMLTVPDISLAMGQTLGSFFLNMIVGFGVSGLIVALGLLSRLGIKK